VCTGDDDVNNPKMPFWFCGKKNEVTEGTDIMAPGGGDPKTAKSVYEFNYVDIDGQNQSMERYKDHVLIVVNVASKWGKTPVNYEQLTALHEKYGARGLKILGFPCNQFANQEPGTEEEIKEFIKGYNVRFDMASKINVNGDDAHPLWKYMKKVQGGSLGSFIKWNFTKFLINKQGQVYKRFGPNEDPITMEPDILKLMEDRVATP